MVLDDLCNKFKELKNEDNRINGELSNIKESNKKASVQLEESNGTDDTATIQNAINSSRHINFAQGETYLISAPLRCGSNNFLHLNYSIIKATDNFVGDSLVLFDTNGVGSAFTNSGIFNGELDGNKLTGGIMARGCVDRFNIDDLYITNIVKPAIFIYSRNRVFGREQEGYYGEPTHYGAEGYNISRVKVIPYANLGEYPCLLLEDSNEVSIEDCKFFGNGLVPQILPQNVNKYGGLITQRISTNVYMNPTLKNVAFAGFNTYGLKFNKYYYPNLIGCTFEALNNHIIFENTKGITFRDNRMMSNSGFDKPKVQLINSSYFNIDISNHAFSDATNLPFIEVTNCTVGTVRSNSTAQIIETNSKDIIYEQINSNGGKFLKGSDANGTYVDYNKALYDIDCGTNRTTPIVMFHKDGKNTLGVGADGNIILQNGAKLFSGQNSPEGTVVAVQGSVYIRTNPTNANEVIYVKASGYNTNTGWVAK